MHESLVEWWNSISLRTKITGVTVLLLTFGLIVTGLGTMTVMRNFLYAEVDTQIIEAASQWMSGDGGTKVESSGGPTDYAIAELDADGDVTKVNPTWIGESDPPDASGVDRGFTAEQAGRPFTLRNEDHTAEWRAVAVPSVDYHSLVIALPLDTTNKAIARMFTLFLLFGIVVVVLGAVLTRLLVMSAFGPLREVERTAAEIADGDFSQRIPGATPNTEVGRLNRSLNTMLSRIDRAFRDRAQTIDQMRRFVGDASHELRTPLVSVRGYAELYRMGALQTPEEVGQAMDRIEREAIRMGGLVADLLELARLDETKPLQLAPVALLPIAKDAALDTMAFSAGRIVSVVTDQSPVAGGDVEIEVIEVDANAAPTESDGTSPAPGISPTAGDRGERRSRLSRGRIGRLSAASGALSRSGLARLRRRRAEGGLPLLVVAEESSTGRPAPQALILGEENKIRQVLTNLLGNAVRFTPTETPIEIVVRADSEADVAVLEVVDHGEGIPPQVREKIFQRFWRADSSRTRDTGGSGLGLAIVQAIVAAHKGTVEVDETPGGGATFRVCLPLLHTEPGPDENPVPA